MTPEAPPPAEGASTPETTVQIREEGPCRKRLKVEVPAERVEEQLETNYRQLRASLQLPGFRKGKVPLSILRGRYGCAAIGTARAASSRSSSATCTANKCQSSRPAAMRRMSDCSS